MKYFKRYLSLLLVCVLLFGAFSTTVSAGYSNNDIINNLYWRYSFVSGTWTYRHSSIYHNVGFQEGFLNSFEWTVDTRTEDKNYYDMFEFNTSENWDANNNTVIFDKGDSFTFTFTKFRNEIEFWDDNNEYHRLPFNTNGVKQVIFQLFDNRGNYVTVNPDTFTLSVNNPNLEGVNPITSYDGTFTVNNVPIDVYKLRVCIKYLIAESYPGYGERKQEFTRFYGFRNKDNFKFSVITEEQETGFFRSIIDWLKGIKDSIVNGLSSVTSGISNMFNELSQLPSKLWNKISEGLKSLFVPDEQYITSYSDKWDSLLSSRFGAIYQVGGLLIDLGGEMLTGLKDNNNNNYSIDFPVAHIPVGNGVTFDFGGWSVPVKVKELSIVYDSLKFVSAVGVTLIFLNGLRKRYDEVMGVEK